MKKLFLVVSILTLGSTLSSCLNLFPVYNLPSSKFKNEFDDYTNKATSTFEVNIYSKEGFAPIERGHFYFINDGSAEKLYVTFYKKPDAFYPEKKFYIRTQKDLIVLPFKYMEDSQYTTQYTTQTVVTDSLSTKITSDTHESVDQTIKLIFEIDSHTKNAIVSATTLSFRVYSGGKSNTFIVKDLNDLKCIFGM